MCSTSRALIIVIGGDYPVSPRLNDCTEAPNDFIRVVDLVVRTSFRTIIVVSAGTAPLGLGWTPVPIPYSSQIMHMTLRMEVVR